MSTKHHPRILLAVLALAVATPGCGVINSLRAKDNLNQGVRDYNKGKYEMAEKKFTRALELDPKLTNAQLFQARSLNALFDQSLSEKDGLKTIDSYDNIIKNNPDNSEAIDQSLAFKASVYEKMAGAISEKAEEYKDKNRQTLLERINRPGVEVKTKADVYYTLGVGFWKESYDLAYPYVSKKQPIPAEVQDKMKPRIRQAHEYLQKTISVDPSYANAWFYEKLVYIEDLKVETNPARGKEILATIQKMQDKYMEMTKAPKPAAGEQSDQSQ